MQLCLTTDDVDATFYSSNRKEAMKLTQELQSGDKVKYDGRWRTVNAINPVEPIRAKLRAHAFNLNVLVHADKYSEANELANTISHWTQIIGNNNATHLVDLGTALVRTTLTAEWQTPSDN